MGRSNWVSGLVSKVDVTAVPILRNKNKVQISKIMMMMMMMMVICSAPFTYTVDKNNGAL